MKKVRITTNKGVSEKEFKIFNSPESLYVWLNDPELQSENGIDSSLGNSVRLLKGEVMEVEWCGCEYIYEQETLLFRADYVRIGKQIKSPSFFTGGKSVVGIQDGWVLADTISFTSKSDTKTKTTKLTSRSRHHFDLDELFEAQAQRYASDDEDIPEAGPFIN
jgi:hypothetical protein